MRIVNPVTRRFAGRLPGFGLLTHVGRTSGRAYITPINVFRRGRHHLFALTYGSDVQWVKNVIAAGGCTLRTRGRTFRLLDPSSSPTHRSGCCRCPSGCSCGRCG